MPGRSELLGVPNCIDSVERHPYWCFALGECQPRPPLIHLQGELAWSGAPQWRRPVETVTVAHRDLL